MVNFVGWSRLHPI